MSIYCFGIDVGGTSVKCGLFKTDGTLLEKWEIPTRTENNGENILPDVAGNDQGQNSGSRNKERRRGGRGNWNPRTDQLKGRGSVRGKPVLGI